MFFLIISYILLAMTMFGTIEFFLLTLSNVLINKKDKKYKRKDIKFAVIIPAHNEEDNIARCVNSLKSCCKNYGFNIFVVADNCSDNTSLIAKNTGAEVLERFSETERGKGYALKFSFDYLKSEDYFAYIIVDADTVVEENFIEIIGNRFSQGAEAVQTAYLVNEPDKSQKTRLMNLALMSMNGFRPLGREKLGISVGILGNGFALSKKLLEEIPYNANSIAEDLEFHIEIVKRQKRVEFIKETTVFADFPLSDEGNASQRARWEGGRFYLQRKFSLELFKEICKGKKRLIEPFIELMTLPLAYQVLLLLTLFFIGSLNFKIYSLFSILITSIHIILSVIYFGKFSDLVVLFKVPKYVIWKIVKLPLIIKQSRKNAQWVRTKRD